MSACCGVAVLLGCAAAACWGDAATEEERGVKRLPGAHLLQMIRTAAVNVNVMYTCRIYKANNNNKPVIM